jgi:hypothetical protein
LYTVRYLPAGERPAGETTRARGAPPLVRRHVRTVTARDVEMDPAVGLVLVLVVVVCEGVDMRRLSRVSEATGGLRSRSPIRTDKGFG